MSSKRVKAVKRVEKKVGNKRPTLTELRKKADSVFSIHIRKKYAASDGSIKCYTCYKYFPSWKQVDNGHFISRIYLATRYEVQNCRPQCKGCNLFGGGKPVEFAKGLEAEEPGLTQKLYKQAQQICPKFDYQRIIDTYDV